MIQGTFCLLNSFAESQDLSASLRQRVENAELRMLSGPGLTGLIYVVFIRSGLPDLTTA